MFVKYVGEVFLLPEYFKFSFEELDEILSSDDLIIESESLVFYLLVKWTNKDVDTRKQDFARLFRHVRLNFLPADKLINTVRKNALVVQFNASRNLVEDALLYPFFLGPNVAKTTKLLYCKLLSVDSGSG